MFKGCKAAYGAGFRHGMGILPMYAKRTSRKALRPCAVYIMPRNLNPLQAYCWRQGFFEAINAQSLFVKLFLFFWRA